MEVLDAAVHRLIKASQTNDCEPRLASAALAQGDRLNDLVSALLDTYNKRTSQRTGTFDPDLEHYPFSSHLGQHIAGELSFFDLTTWALGHLRFQMADVFFATGGYIFFAKYRVSAGVFFVVAKLNDSLGQAFSEDMTQVTEARHISTDRLQQVGRINLRGWSDNSGKYLTFVNAREGGRSADYFVKFLGCAEPTNPKQETQKLVHVIDGFCKAKDLDKLETISFKRKAHVYLTSLPEGEAFSMESLANAISPAEPQAFLQFVNEHDDAPTDGAALDRRMLRPLVNYVIRMDGATLTMSSDFKAQHEVQVTNDGDLIIRGINATAVRKQLE